MKQTVLAYNILLQGTKHTCQLPLPALTWQWKSLALPAPQSGYFGGLLAFSASCEARGCWGASERHQGETILWQLLGAWLVESAELSVEGLRQERCRPEHQCHSERGSGTTDTIVQVPS